MEDMNAKNKELSVDDLEKKLNVISEDINIICKLMAITLILEIFILVFFLLVVQGA